ncbi:molybdenum cofactor guanylyltransferase [Chloroflexota bacterium]
MEANCIILAGGKGLRLGRDKGLETVGESSLLKRVVFSVAFLNSDIIIVTATKLSLPQPISHPKLKTAADIYPGKGSLGGIHTGLVASEAFYNLVVACDMPFLNEDLLRYMLQVAPGFDAVVPRLDNMVEPLHTIYSKDCLAPIKQLLEQGKLSVTELFSLVNTRYIEVDEIDRFDPEHLSFFNINTKADLQQAKELAKIQDTAIKEGDISSDKR